MKIKTFLIGCFCGMGLFPLQAQHGWTPQSVSGKQEYRLLECGYNEAQLESSRVITPASTTWKVDTKQEKIPEGVSYTFTFTAQQALENAGVAVAFDEYDWSSDNYVMIPAAVYNGNRQRIVNREYATGLDKSDYYRKDLALTSNPIPQLSPEFGSPSLLELSVCNVATPAIVYMDRRKGTGVILLTEQGFEPDGYMLDHGLTVAETPDRHTASFVISAPGVRSRKPEFIGFSESPDRGVSVAKGGQIVLKVTKIDFPCRDIPQLLARFMQVRKIYTSESEVRNLMPMSEVFSRMTQNIDERYYEEGEFGFYCPENANWMSYGWVGGLINTYPMLALGDTGHLRKVKNTFDFALPAGKGESGFFYDVLGADGKVVYRDAAALVPGIGLTRKNADVLYWMVKQFNLLKEQGREDRIAPAWEAEIRRLADAFVSTWKKNGTWGNYVNVETGEIAVYNTTSGAMAVGGLALASAYYKEPAYQEVACEAAAYYYDSFALLGFTSGGCGDILQNADSETAAALMTSLMTLYEVTGEQSYLKQSADLAHLCATWTVSFPYRLPAGTPLAKLGANLTGAVWASTQNKHGAPGFCTQSGDALFKLYRATGDTLYAGLLRDIIHAHAEGVQPNGKITERLTYCDADSRGSRGDGGKTGWNETNGALMALEIPGVYIRTDLDAVYVFDHVDVKIVKKNSKQIVLQFTNPTAFDAIVTVFAEDGEQACRPLGDNAFLHWTNKIAVKAGETVNCKLKTKE
ncbi:hypothetical protein [Parabacteroides sp. AF48-14]|uniref:hypothetical protein n=1 Tax=Parabacteroides sp. AF48-14 TaxID=2292052 RepID=UPI001F3553A4|nr:hypothetical protein [Parabacteroides sp. AF48-14]